MQPLLVKCGKFETILKLLATIPYLERDPGQFVNALETASRTQFTGPKRNLAASLERASRTQVTGRNDFTAMQKRQTKQMDQF